MSEYMERHSVSRLIGAPPGYVGFDQGGLLTDKVNQHPHCVVLFDEIEKAHPDVFNVLLQVMDYGKLTDHNGRTVDFRNVILCMTTNAGAADIAKPALGFGREQRHDEDDDAINRMFAPEFRNRLDAIVKFASLGPESMGRVVDKFGKLSKGGTVRVDVDGQGDAAKLVFQYLPPERGALPPANQEPVLAE